jgi:nicotinamidase-related amidase
MQTQQPASTGAEFLDYLGEWERALPGLSLNEAVPNPERAAVLSVDVINGFCNTGPLASPRVARIVPPIQALFQSAWDYGVRHFVLIQDTHDPDAAEFNQWPAHCVRGSIESEAVAEFKDLPFYNEMVTIPKNSIHAALHTGLSGWMLDHPELTDFIVVGDCTDLCAYQLAMYLRLDANAAALQRRVILPANCVDTYDLPLNAARSSGAYPHPAGILHGVFLYHMALNGVEVVSSIEA